MHGSKAEVRAQERAGVALSRQSTSLLNELERSYRCFSFTHIHFRLTKGRTKARQRKMHQIARLLELPGNVGPSCPSPPSLNLHSLRKEAAAQSELEICRGGDPDLRSTRPIRVHIISTAVGRAQSACLRRSCR